MPADKHVTLSDAMCRSGVAEDHRGRRLMDEASQVSTIIFTCLRSVSGLVLRDVTGRWLKVREGAHLITRRGRFSSI